MANVFRRVHCPLIACIHESSFRPLRNNLEHRVTARRTHADRISHDEVRALLAHSRVVVDQLTEAELVCFADGLAGISLLHAVSLAGSRKASAQVSLRYFLGILGSTYSSVPTTMFEQSAYRLLRISRVPVSTLVFSEIDLQVSPSATVYVWFE